jgi:hypothetical protein
MVYEEIEELRKMTKNDRIKKQKELLSKIAADINEDVRAKAVKLDQANYPGYLPSTWYSLFQKRFLRHTGEKEVEIFFLNPSGWLRGLQLNGELKKDTEFISRLKTVCLTLRKLAKKNAVDVRPLDEIAAKAKVPTEWLANVIDSESIEYRFNKIGINWANEKNNSVFIPPNVGLNKSAQTELS